MRLSQNAGSGCSYAVDAHDRISAVNDDWMRFAEENHGEELAPQRVLQSCLWDHVLGMENRILYKRILDHVRETRRSVVFQFRCDAPDRERLLQMTVSSAAAGGCLFRTQMVRWLEREPILILARDVPRSSLRIPLCGWCMRVDVAGRWLELGRAAEWLGVMSENSVPQVAHTICPSCYEKLDRELARPPATRSRVAPFASHRFRD